MAHVELQLLSRIIRAGCIEEVIEWGMTNDDFRTTEGLGLFNSILGYWSSVDTRGAVPGPMLIKEYYPTFEFCDDPAMTTAALCSEVRRNRVAGELKELMLEAGSDADIDPMGVLSKMANKVASLQSLGMKVNDLTFDKAMDDLWQRYVLAEQGGASTGILWPWAPFNEQTMGIQNDDYIVLYGRPKSMKSFVLAEMAARCYDQGKHVLVYTKEMPAWQLFRRVAACVAHLPYDGVRLGKLNEVDRKTFGDLYHLVKDTARATYGRTNITCISGRDAPAGQDSMSWVRSKIAKVKPDIVFIDGLYLMSADGKPGRDHERVASISRAGRQMVLDTGIPLVATMQANRNAAKHANAELDEIAYSDAIGQDATVAMRVINEKQDANIRGVATPCIALVIAGSREFKLHGVRIGKQPCVDFDFKAEMSESDIQKVTEKDNEGGEGEKKDGVLKRNPSNTKGNPTAITPELHSVKNQLKEIM